MPICTYCGRQGSEDVKFCNQCGQQFLTEAHAERSDEEVDKRAWLLRKAEEMQPNGTCAYCANRLPKNTCGSKQSSYSGTAIKHTDKCESFTENPAQIAYARALFLDSYAEKAGLDIHETVNAFGRAIKLGLPADDELNAHFRIAKCLVFWIGNQHLDPLKRSKLSEAQQAIMEFESALVLDREGGFGFFEEERGRFLLSQLDLLYAVEGGILSIERGVEGKTSDATAIEYWEKKFPFCNYLSTNPLIMTLVQAGYSYSRLGNKQAAIKCFRQAAEAAPVDISNKGESEVEQKKEARICLEQLMSEAEQVQSASSRSIAEVSKPAGVTQTAPEEKLNKKALISVICGIVGLLVLGWILGPIALLLGLQARAGISKLKTGSLVKATAGIILGVLATLFGVISLLQRM